MLPGLGILVAKLAFMLTSLLVFITPRQLGPMNGKIAKNPWGVKALSKARIHLKGDERILGDSDFVKEVLDDQKERYERSYWHKAQGYDINRVVAKVADIFEMESDEIWKPGNQPLRVKARSLVCYWAVREVGMSGTSVGKRMGVGQPAVSRAVRRGEKLSQDLNVTLIK